MYLCWYYYGYFFSNVFPFKFVNILLLELVQVNYLADCSLEILDDPSCVALVEVSLFFLKFMCLCYLVIWDFNSALHFLF